MAPAELEGHLLDHPDVADVCVVGIPHEYHGEVPLAYVVLSLPAQERVRKDPLESQKIKERLIKVSRLICVCSMCGLNVERFVSACGRRKG